MLVQAPEVVAGTPFDLVPIPGLADSSNSGPPQSDRTQVVSDAMSGFSEMAVSPYGGAVSAAQHPSAQKAPDSAVPAPVAANQLPGETDGQPLCGRGGHCSRSSAFIGGWL